MSKANWIVLAVFFAAIGLFVFGVAIWDIWLAEKYTTSLTISWSMALLAVQYPFMVFLIGLFSGGIIIGLAAHFWANQDTPADWAELLQLRKDNAIMRTKLHLGPNDPVE